MKIQSKAQSLNEAIVNVVVGFLITLGVQYFIYPLFGIHLSISGNLLIASIFTVISIARSYVLRRLFNWLDERRFNRFVNYMAPQIKEVFKDIPGFAADLSKPTGHSVRGYHKAASESFDNFIESPEMKAAVEHNNAVYFNSQIKRNEDGVTTGFGGEDAPELIYGDDGRVVGFKDEKYAAAVKYDTELVNKQRADVGLDPLDHNVQINPAPKLYVGKDDTDVAALSSIRVVPAQYRSVGHDPRVTCSQCRTPMMRQLAPNVFACSNVACNNYVNPLQWGKLNDQT